MSWRSFILCVVFMAASVGGAQHEEQQDERKAVLSRNAEAMQRIGKELQNKERLKGVKQAHMALKAEKGEARGPPPSAEHFQRISDDLKRAHKNAKHADRPEATAHQGDKTLGHDAAMKNAHRMSRNNLDLTHVGKPVALAGADNASKMKEQFAKAMESKHGRGTDVSSRTATKQAHHELEQQFDEANVSKHEKKVMHERLRDAMKSIHPPPVRKTLRDYEE